MARDNWESHVSYDSELIPSDFDWKKYINAPSNEDLRRAGIDTKVEAERHFAVYGRNERRAGAPGIDNWLTGSIYNRGYIPQDFDWEKYINAPSNEDLRRAGIDTKTEAERHFALYGRSENRAGLPDWYNKELAQSQKIFESGEIRNPKAGQVLGYVYELPTGERTINKESGGKPIAIYEPPFVIDYDAKRPLTPTEKYNVVAQAAGAVDAPVEWGMGKGVLNAGYMNPKLEAAFKAPGEIQTFANIDPTKSDWAVKGASVTLPQEGKKWYEKVVSSPVFGLGLMALGVPAGLSSALGGGIAGAAGAGALLGGAQAAATGGDFLKGALTGGAIGGFGAGALFEIPAISNSVNTIANTLGVSASTAGMIVNGAINLVANGGNLEAALRTTLAQELGGAASNYASQLAGLQGMKGLDTILKSVTKDSTQALLLNKDVESAAKNALIGSAIPLALRSTPGWSSLSKTQQSMATNAALSAAKGGKMDIGAAIRNGAAEVFTEAAMSKIGGALTESQKQLARQSIMAGIQGKPLDTALQNFLIGEARTAVKNQVAQAEGWKDDVQKQQAIKLYGNKVNPNDYAAKQQGWEDYAEKQAALKSYGDKITPLGFKEREQVKSIDPGFDAEAYAKLNEVTGDPFQHFLEQGKKSNLPTNYEKGAEAALASLGYKPDAGEIKEVASLFKTASDPDVALGKYYDDRWVSPEEAAAAAKDAGFELTPEQLAKFTGQARGGQNAVFEDIATAANIGKTAQQQRETFVNNYLSDVTKAYKEQGYTDAEIAAAMPDIRSRVNEAAEQNVKQLADYADQTKAAYGAASPEYAAARKKLLETQSAIGGYGVVQEGNQFKSLTGDAYKSDAPGQSTSWRGGTRSNWSGVYDKSGQEYTIGDYLRLSPGSQVFDATGKPLTVGAGMSMEISGTQAQEIGSLAHIGKSAEDKLLPGPLAALFGGQAGGGAKTGTGFSLIGRTGAGEPVYGQEGSDFSLITLSDGRTKAVNPKTQEVYLVPPQQVAALLPKAPTAPEEQVPKAVQDIIKAADEKRISPQEAQKVLEELSAKAGYKATPEELQRQASAMQGEKTPEQLQREIDEYIGARMVTPEEVRQTYKDLGLQAPTEEDVLRFAGQREQAGLMPELTQYLPTASANVALQLAQRQAAEAQAAAAGQADIQAKITAAEKKLADFADETGQNFSNLKSQFDIAFKDAQTQGVSADAALQAAINKVAAESAASQKATNEQIGKLGADVGGVQTSIAQLGAATQQQFGDVNARIDQLQRQGLSQAEATSQALRELSSGQTQLGQQIGEQQQQTQSKFGELDTRIAQLQQQGMSQADATNKALQELAGQQTQLGQQIGTVQAGLGQQIGNLGQQVGGLGQALTGLIGQFGTATQGMQQQIQQAQQQAQMGNLLTILGLGQKESKPQAPLALVGEIRPYEFSSDLLAGIYKPNTMNPYLANDQLLKLARG